MPINVTPFQHQQAATDFWMANPEMLNLSDAGSGKTLATLLAIAKRKEQGIKGKALVFAPLSILQPAWGNDIDKFGFDLTYSIAYAKNREQAFNEDVDIVITNHDAVKWITKNREVMRDFHTLVIDESTAFKNPQSQRSKAMVSLAAPSQADRKKGLEPEFDYKVLLTGTPNPNGVMDLFNQAKICDGGERLGNNYFGFRNQVCTPKQVGPDPSHVEWVDKPTALDMVSGILSDITFRVKLEDCVDMPEQSFSIIYTKLPPKIKKEYERFKSDSVVELESGVVTAIHAGARTKKLLQIASGSVYDEEGTPLQVHKERYELVMELLRDRDQSLVAFNWKHERDEMIRLCEKEGWTYGLIDGSVGVKQREELVKQFQNGEIKVIFAHPQSAGHGLTLTNGTTVIWASPTYSSELYEQFNRRIYRTGQKQKTEIIRICAEGTAEETVIEKLDNKCEKLQTTLELFRELTGFAA